LDKNYHFFSCTEDLQKFKKYDPYELMQDHEHREQQPTSKRIFLDNNNAPV
jgi:hypothetical protein